MSIGSNFATFVFLLLTLLSALPVYTIPAPLRTVGKVVDRILTANDPVLMKRNGGDAANFTKPIANVTKGVVAFDGQDCVAVDVDLQSVESPSTGSITVWYKGIYGHVSNPSYTDLAICTVHINLNVNTGWILTVSGADVEGFFDLQEGVTAEAETLIAMDDSSKTTSFKTTITKEHSGGATNKTFSYDTMGATYSCPMTLDNVSQGQQVPLTHTFMMTNKVFMTNGNQQALSVFGVDPTSSEYRNSVDGKVKAYKLTYKYNLAWCGN